VIGVRGAFCSPSVLENTIIRDLLRIAFTA
jgi:hypothetical protein